MIYITAVLLAGYDILVREEHKQGSNEDVKYSMVIKLLQSFHGRLQASYLSFPPDTVSSEIGSSAANLDSAGS